MTSSQWQPGTALPGTVGEIVATIIGMGLLGEPHRLKTTLTGRTYKPDGRAKQKEGARRRERGELLEKLKVITADDPLPEALRDEVERVLSGRRRGAA